jgi:multimeric flavodoxin WrbA
LIIGEQPELSLEKRKGRGKMRVIISDLGNDDLERLFPQPLTDTILVKNDGPIHHCLGCFGCWVKTPGACVIRDPYGDMGECLSQCTEVLIISKCYYGGLSPFVKNVVDRSIPYIHPYFVIKNGRMHHRSRYKNHFDLKVWFYGDDITAKEKQTAEKLVKANAINMHASKYSVTFVRDIAEMEGEVR